MKRILTILAVSLVVVGAQAQTTIHNYNLTQTGTASIPDGNMVGVMNTFNVSGLGSLDLINSVTISLDINGGFNGDLYAYLAGPGGQMAVLLNRVGLSAANNNLTGYGNTGFLVTFDNAAGNGNIHSYGNTPPLNGFGQVTGSWVPDGRNINPQSTPSAFDSASTSANLGVFAGLNAATENGNWTLFVADVVSGGGSPTMNLNSSVLSITTVPEPGTVTLAVGGGLLLLAVRRRR
jgi:subtilisin-like proprotein convertase family protein